jgi:cell division septation protein DedD
VNSTQAVATAAAGPAKAISLADRAEPATSSKKWSVQISAAPGKDSADHLIAQLKAKGYDGYVAQAEVKGQTYYRVRVGHFDKQEEAESLRQQLVHQAGYQDAYLAGD